MNRFEVVKQLEVEHNIQKDSEDLTKYIKELDLKNQVATLETVKFLKQKRAENNKELASTKQSLKEFIDFVSPPIVKIKNDVKMMLIEPRETLDKEFKTKIAFVEDKIKDEKAAELAAYFTECCIASQIDFIEFDQVGIKINLTDTVKSQQKVCEAFFVKVHDDLSLIDTQEHKVEILADYKQTLNVSSSIKTIVDRKAREKAEADRIVMQAWSKRKGQLLDLAVVYHSETETFEYNENIYVSETACRAANDEEFTKIVSDLKEQITAQSKPSQETKPAPLAKPTTKPTVEPERIETARFECKASLPKLKALGQYMKDNGIIYSNIKNK